MQTLKKKKWVSSEKSRLLATGWTDALVNGEIVLNSSNPVVTQESQNKQRF